MKKELIIVGVIMIALLLGLDTYHKVNYSNMVKEYEMKINKLTNENEELSDENSNLSKEVTDLHKNIYNLFEKKAYTISIKRNNETVIYQQHEFGLFDSYTKTVLK